MSEQTFWGVVTIFSLVLVGLASVLIKHIMSDAEVRESTAKEIATLKADNSTTKEEVRSLRTAMHDLRNKVSEILSGWFLKMTGKSKD